MRRLPIKRAGEVVAHVLLDDEDHAHLSQWAWVLSRRDRGYATRGAHRGETIVMHRLIMGLRIGDPRQVDHINGNTLDNRRANLRIATVEQQALNRRSARGSSSRFKGVCWRKDARKWWARVRRRGQTYSLGCFDTEEEAAEAIVRLDESLGIEISVLDLAAREVA